MSEREPSDPMNGLESPVLYQRLSMAALRAGVVTRDVFCVAPDVCVAALTTVLLERGLDAVLVIDRVGRIVGVLSGAEHEDIDPQLTAAPAPNELL